MLPNCPHRRIYCVVLCVHNSIKASCKRNNSLQEIVALLLSIGFPIYSCAITAFKSPLPEPSLGLLSIPAGNASIVTEGSHSASLRFLLIYLYSSYT